MTRRKQKSGVRNQKPEEKAWWYNAAFARNQKQILRCAALRSRRGGTCHPDPALREKDLFFFAPRDEVRHQCYSAY